MQYSYKTDGLFVLGSAAKKILQLFRTLKEITFCDVKEFLNIKFGKTWWKFFLFDIQNMWQAQEVFEIYNLKFIRFGLIFFKTWNSFCNFRLHRYKFRVFDKAICVFQNASTKNE